jgi:hypothetical protein
LCVSLWGAKRTAPSLWLAVARFIVPREVSEKFFIYPGFGIISDFSRWLFEQAYERDISG